MRRLGLLLFAVLVLVGCQRVPEQAARPTPTTATATTVAAAAGHPKVTVTPGVVLTTSTADVCTAGWASKHRHSLTAKQKAAVLAAYGYPAGQKVAEWDHLVSLELGGGGGVANIWPQVSDPDQQRKDQLENVLHRQVCSGRLPLGEAQARIKAFWRYW